MNIIKLISEMVCVKIMVSAQQGGALSQTIFLALSIKMLHVHTQKINSNGLLLADSGTFVLNFYL